MNGYPSANELAKMLRAGPLSHAERILIANAFIDQQEELERLKKRISNQPDRAIRMFWLYFVGGILIIVPAMLLWFRTLFWLLDIYSHWLVGK